MRKGGGGRAQDHVPTHVPTHEPPGSEHLSVLGALGPRRLPVEIRAAGTPHNGRLVFSHWACIWVSLERSRPVFSTKLLGRGARPERPLQRPTPGPMTLLTHAGSPTALLCASAGHGPQQGPTRHDPSRSPSATIRRCLKQAERTKQIYFNDPVLLSNTSEVQA